MKLAGLWRICISLLLTLGGLLVVFGLSRIETQAADNPPPYVQAPHFAHITTVTTPTLPTRFTLLAPAFELIATDSPFTLTIDARGFSEAGQLAYRPNVNAPWQRIKLARDTQKALWLVPNAPCGTYAVVSVTAATRPPTGAMVIDDLSANFQRYGETANWHAVTGSKYYLEHAYWTYNTYNAIENYGIWTPTTGLSGAYAVQVFVPGNYADTERAVYQIYHDNQTAVYTLSQNSYWAEWVNVGVYTFTPATASYVKLTDVTYEDIYTNWVAFDAVAFVPQIRHVYLPTVLRNYPRPPAAPKLSTGIHLGNRTADWTLEMLQPIDGDQGGVWPAAVVVLSDQVWTIERSPTTPCTITRAYPRPDRPIVYNYLKRAASNGTRVIVRIYPSPGNFIDWDDPLRQNHRLMFGATPAGGHYCYSENWPKSPDWPYGFQYFRTATDIVAEMAAIHTSNMMDGWSEGGFEPANEPNIEWYSMAITSSPRLNDYIAWDEMDTYFSSIYQIAHAQYAGEQSFKIFTPPMSQSAFETNVNWDTCAEDVSLNDGSTGYGHMLKTYGSDNDGYDWHNYWLQGKEAYRRCRDGGNQVVYAFPTWILYNIYSSDAHITEADLASQCQMSALNPIEWKDSAVTTTSESLQHFFSASFLPDVHVVWLLNDNTHYTRNPGDCYGITDERQLREHDWHEAYDEDDRDPPYGDPFHLWFTNWWPTAD